MNLLKVNHIALSTNATNLQQKYLKTVVAFANGNGGSLVFGIDDNSREIVGIDTCGDSSIDDKGIGCQRL